MRDVARREELGEVEKATHAAGVRTAVDLEEELLAGRRGENVGMMRAAARPELDADAPERAARDLVGRARDLILRRRDRQDPHDRRDSSGGRT